MSMGFRSGGIDLSGVVFRRDVHLSGSRVKLAETGRRMIEYERCFLFDFNGGTMLKSILNLSDGPQPVISGWFHTTAILLKITP
jgi:hypothetical protein